MWYSNGRGRVWYATGWPPPGAAAVEHRGVTLMSFDGDPDHPILADPFRWDLLEFVYRRDPNDYRESHIDMTFGREGLVRRLRFYAPQDLEMSRGLPNAFGMCILDVSGRQLEGIAVRVANFEQSYGAPRFWAARVVDLDDPGDAEVKVGKG
jgi:hypothetical protein